MVFSKGKRGIYFSLENKSISEKVYDYKNGHVKMSLNPFTYLDKSLIEEQTEDVIEEVKELIEESYDYHIKKDKIYY